MKINTECEICSSTIKNAVSCIECNNFFCKSCIEKWINCNTKKNIEKSCPHCRTTNFKYKESPELDYLINTSSSLLKCQKCLRIFFNNEEFKSHQLLCLQIKCIICHEIFKDSESFINHFDQEGRYKEKILICNYLNANPYSYIQRKNIINYNENDMTINFPNINNIPKYKSPSTLIKDEIRINPFQNNFKKNENLKNNNVFNKYKNSKMSLNNYYDLFYCNQINCVNNKLCSPGNEFCSSCMKINQEYHKLKKHYLINSAGRVCTYNRNNFHCLCHFERCFKKENKLFYPDLICLNDYICKPCNEMNKLIHFYLDKNLINKLKKRDENNGY